jgi:hypothetical protein
MEAGPLVDGSGQTKNTPMRASLPILFTLSGHLIIGAEKIKTHLPASIFCYGMLPQPVSGHLLRSILSTSAGKEKGKIVTLKAVLVVPLAVHSHIIRYRFEPAAPSSSRGRERRARACESQSVSTRTPGRRRHSNSNSDQPARG